MPIWDFTRVQLINIWAHASVEGAWWCWRISNMNGDGATLTWDFTSVLPTNNCGQPGPGTVHVWFYSSQIRKPHFMKKSTILSQSCQKPMEGEVTITIHCTVITDSLLWLAALYLSVMGVQFQAALLITHHRHSLRTISGWGLQNTAYFLNVSFSL